MANQPTYYPKFLPFPVAIRRNRGPVPNRQSVDWPQSQFAPLYLPEGSASFQPYVYNDGPVTRYQPLYMLPAQDAAVNGPGGDIAQLPSPPDYGAMMYFARANEGEVAPDAASAAAQVQLQADMLALEPAVAQDALVAEAVAAPLPFEPFAPEHLHGLNERRQKRLQRLDSILTRLSTAQRGPVLERLYQRLLAAHERIEKHLEARAERQSRRKGLLGKTRKVSRRVRTAQIATRIRTTEGQDKGGLSEVERIQKAYDSKRINKAQYDRLMGLAQRA